MSLKELLRSSLGFGTAPIGNMFRAISDEDALATIAAAWALAGKPRDAYVLSTKVGRVVLDEIDAAGDGFGDTSVFRHSRPNKVVNDYSADATLRSIAGSLERLRADRLDIVFVHDVAQDFYGDAWLGVFEHARQGAFRALDQLRDEGVIGAWGLGVNRVEPIELLLGLQQPRPDGFLLVGRYTFCSTTNARCSV
jgi:D-threo-aldose 1-dehydrogenase